jgi:hypothetical protein
MLKEVIRMKKFLVDKKIAVNFSFSPQNCVDFKVSFT